MKACLFVVLLCVFEFGSCGKIKSATTAVRYLRERNNNITINIMVHFDTILTWKLIKEHRIKTRKKLKIITNAILKDATKFFAHPTLNQKVNFKIIDTRFLRNSKIVALDENAARYLESYCEWQTRKKLARKTVYYSVLLTGLDLFSYSNGRQVRTNSGRSYTSGACSISKSCALIEWDPKLIGFLFAHEIGHSLGMRHDGAPYNRCREQNHVMATRYSAAHHPRTWSSCSLTTLKQFLKSSKSWCVKNVNIPGLKYI